MHVKYLSANSARPVCLAAAILSLGLCVPKLSNAQTDFTRLPGTARSIGVGANGALWVIGTGAVGTSGDYNIFRWAGTQWERTSGSGVKIAVDHEGNALVLNSVGRVYRYSFAGNPPWEQLPGTASDIASGPKGELWAIGPRQQTPDGNILRWTYDKWEQAPGNGVQITVDPKGAPWVVNSENELYERDLARKTWIKHTVKLRSIAIGASGAKFAVSTEAKSGGNYAIYQEVAGSWYARSASGVAVTVGPSGEPYVLNAAGEIFRGTSLPQTTIVTSGDLVVSEIQPEPGLNQPPIVAAEKSGWSRDIIPFSGGRMVCSGAACGTTKADWVGPYQLDLTCDEGTYFPQYGGTCWGCPADDRSTGGAWILNPQGLDEENGCFRSLLPRFGKATWIKLGWNWDCNHAQGEFWDTHDANGNFVFGGSCWKCADPLLTKRTAFWIAGPEACRTALTQTAPPTLLRYNGCSEPDVEKMGLPGQRQPDKPFLDILGGWSAGAASGACFACPVIHENGDVLITSRNIRPLTDRANNQGCDINFRWTMPQFPEPGLSGLDGIKEQLFERQTLIQPAEISLYLRAEATAKEMTDDQADRYVAEEWRKVAETPYKSVLRTVLYDYLLQAAALPEAERTLAERKVIASFENYIRVRQAFVAQQALNMYDRWKVWSDTEAPRTQLQNVIYFGNVPFDFHKALANVAGLGSVGLMVAGSVFSAQHYLKNSRLDSVLEVKEKYVKVTELRGNPNTPQARYVKTNVKTFRLVRFGKSAPEYLLKGFNLFKGTAVARAYLAVSSNAVMTGALLLQLGIQHAIDVYTARQKLEDALKAADQPVNLNQLLASPNGADLVLAYWAKAMEAGAEKEDPQLLQMAKTAYAAAQAKEFWPY